MHYNLIKSASRAFLEEINNRKSQMPLVYECINLVQSTPYRVNKKVLEVSKSIWDKGLTIGKIPSKFNLPIPPKPFDIATNKEARINWSRQKKAICDYNATLDSKRLLFAKIFSIATDYLLYEKIYFPCQYDWRWRLYQVPQFFNVQANDLARGLLLFANGKEIGSEQALARLAIHGANTYGLDKEPFEKRIDWVEINKDKILSTAREPHNNYEFWGEASEPFQFLAFCFEWEAFVNNGETNDFITHLPCYSDCSNSGLQIFSGLLADENGGKATNLIPQEKPADVYLEVANETLRLINLEPDSLLKTMWLQYGINRYTTKKVTMCVVYGLSQFSCRQYIQEHLDENEDDGIPNPFSTDKNKIDNVPTTFKATAYLSKIVWKALDNVIVSAKEAMLWLQQVSKLVADNNLPMTWTTPIGAIVQMKCPVMETKRINTNMGEKIWRPKLKKFVNDIRKTTIQIETNKINKKKVANSISPCFIHSIDSAILAKAVSIAHKEGVNDFACVHDSFGVLAPDVVKINYAVRKAFVDIFNNKNLLEDFLNEIKPQIKKEMHHKIPPIPKKRNLNIGDVMDSHYFCS